MTDSISYYELLGLGPDASSAEVKAAYRASMRKFHPDMGGSDAQAALFQRAYEVLADPDRRRAYDDQLASPGRPDQDHSTSAPGEQPAADPTWGVDDVWDDGATEPDSTRGPADPPRFEPPSMSPDAAPAGVTVVPTFDADRTPYVVSAAIWSALWIATLAYLLSSSSHGLTLGAVIVMAVLAAPPHWFDQFPIVRIIGTLDLIVIGLICLARADTDPAYLLWAVCVGCGLVVVACLGWAWSRTARLNNVVNKKAAFDHNQWGAPGQLDGGSEPIVSDMDSPRRFAARATDQALGPLYAVPGVKMLHGLPWPGFPGETVDHIVLAGNRLAILQSQALASGSYRYDGAGSLLRDGAHFVGGQTWVEAAAAAWQRELPGAVVKPFLVGHSLDGGRVHFVHDPAASVTCTGPENLAPHVRQFLSPVVGIVDRGVLAKLLTTPHY